MAAGIFLSLSLSSCFESKPKVLGNNKIGLDVTDTANSETFRFNYAYLDTTLAAPHNRTVTLQGAANSRSPIIATCNSAATSCVCEFLNAGGTEIEESVPANMQYDSTGNYIRCAFTGAVPARVRIRNIAETKLSTTFTIKTPAAGANPITIQELFADLDVNRIRTIFRYDCTFNFLQKHLVSSGSIDCTAQAANPCHGTNQYCILQARYPFFLFQDNLASNFGSKIADLLYNAGSSDKICERQIKRIDCTGTTGTPAEDFGLYNEQTGIYQIALGLSAGPGIANQTYGFAAEIDTFLATNICPPGLVPKRVYEATPDPTDDLLEVTAGGAANDNNIPLNFTAFNIDDAAAPSLVSLEFDKLAGNSGGDTNCDGVNCAVPTTKVADPQAFFNYAASVATPATLCVVPDDLLP
jgi:hypothetical protein